jgi:hypothetical protein
MTGRRSALLGLTLVLVACLNDDVVGSTTLTGAYVLRTVNASPPPVIIAGSGSDKTEILDDVITFFEGGSYAENGHRRVTVSGQATDEVISETGRYSPLSNSISLTSSTGQLRSAIGDGKSLKMVQAGITWYYSK